MGPRIDHYTWRRGREALLRFGGDAGPVLIAALPLFEEANRTRTFVVTLLRTLAERDIASLLPDVPGQGESMMSLTSLTLSDMAEAYAAVTDRCLSGGRKTFALGIRSGALLDGYATVAGRWHFAPQTGEDLLRDLARTWRAAGGARDHDLLTQADSEPVEIAGNLLSGDLLSSLNTVAAPDPSCVPRRVVRLLSDARAADHKLDAVPLWRRAEPESDPALAHRLADDIATWLATCGA